MRVVHSTKYNSLAAWFSLDEVGSGRTLQGTSSCGLCDAAGYVECFSGAKLKSTGCCLLAQWHAAVACLRICWQLSIGYILSLLYLCVVAWVSGGHHDNIVC